MDYVSKFVVANLIREKITAKHSQMTQRTIAKSECAYSLYKKKSQQQLKKKKKFQFSQRLLYVVLGMLHAHGGIVDGFHDVHFGTGGNFLYTSIESLEFVE